MFRAKLQFFSGLISQSILNRLPSNLHKVGLIFQEDRNKGNNPMFRAKLSQSILNRLPSNLNKVGLIFQGDSNKGQSQSISVNS